MKNQSTFHIGGVSLVAAIVYLITCAPGLYYTDSGELAAAASVWGVAHPTGYPLFTLVAHLWSMLPFSSVIGGLNTLSALVMAATAGVTAALINDVLARTTTKASSTSKWVIADAVALLVAFSPTIWSQATSIEVYALNTLLLVLVLFVGLRSSNNVKFTALGGLLVGLMFANHLSVAFLVPGLLVLWWMLQPDNNTAKKHLPWLLSPLVFGASLYALLPLRSAQTPPINWGWVHRGWDEFLYHVKGTQFGVWMFSEDDAVTVNSNIFFDLANQELLWGGWLAVIIGLFAAWKSSKPLAVGLILIATGNLIVSLGYSIPDIDSYFIPTFVVLGLFFAIGIAFILERLPQKVSLVALALPVVAVGLNFNDQDLSDHTAVDAYTEWTIANAEPNAIIFTRQWDYLCSAFWYKQTVEGVRPDIAMIDKELFRRTWYTPYLQQLYPNVMKGAQVAIDNYTPWLEQFENDSEAFNANPRNGAEIQKRFVAMLNAIIDNNPDRPIYMTLELVNEEPGFAVGYDAIPVGPMLRITKNREMRPRTSLDGIREFASAIGNRPARLDSGLRQTVLTALATDALYSIRTLADTALYQELYNETVAIDNSGKFRSSLNQRVGSLR